jgi:hypothetical protein
LTTETTVPFCFQQHYDDDEVIDDDDQQVWPFDLLYIYNNLIWKYQYKQLNFQYR